jgi:chemotaxis protein methyltransferase CheR
MLIGVTSLFRDPPVFDCLRKQVLPRLLAETTGRLRVWSVGCSDGAEIFSLAMLLDRQGALERCELLGTDCRADAIAIAQQGLFDAEALRTLPTDMQLAYFANKRGRWQLCDRLRRQVRWRVADVTQTIEPGQWDVILCRNVAMYMRSSVIAVLWERLQWALGPGGVLVLGKAERPIGQMRLNTLAPCIYRRSY